MQATRKIRSEILLLLPILVLGIYSARYLREKQGQKALLEAISRDDASAAIDLLNRGINPRNNKPRGAAPISLAASARAFNTLQALLKRGERPAPDDVVMPALRDDLKMTDMLLAAGADPNGHVRGLIPLMLELASQRKTNTMSHMLALGANPNVISTLSWNKPLGCTPLMASVLAVNPDGVSTLLKWHCRLNDKIDDPASVWNGYSALMMAVKMHDVRTVKMLLAAGARSDIKSADGKTAALLATELNEKDMILMLANKPGTATRAH